MEILKLPVSISTVFFLTVSSKQAQALYVLLRGGGGLRRHVGERKCFHIELSPNFNFWQKYLVKTGKRYCRITKLKVQSSFICLLMCNIKDPTIFYALRSYRTLTAFWIQMWTSFCQRGDSRIHRWLILAPPQTAFGLFASAIENNCNITLSNYRLRMRFPPTLTFFPPAK